MIVARICPLESRNLTQQGCREKERERVTFKIRLYDVARYFEGRQIFRGKTLGGIKMSFLFFGWREASLFSHTKREIRLKYENVLFFLK